MNRVIRSKAECWTGMRIVWCLLLCFCFIGCGRATVDDNAALRRRAEGFGDLLVRIQNMPELDARQMLEGFIEPSSTREDRIAQYYRDFSATSKKFRIVSQSVTDITINSDLVNANVTYRTIAQSPGGTRIPVEQVTQWIHVGDKWYRTIGKAKKAIDQ